MRLTDSLLLSAGVLLFSTVPALAEEPATPQVTGMAYVCVTVDDQDAALKWYTETLSMTVTMDMPYNEDGDRWLTLAFPGQDEMSFPQLVLYKSNPAMENAAGMPESGPVSNIVISTSDCAGMVEILRAAGAEILSEATDQGYGIEAIWNDPYGNNFTMVQSTWDGSEMPEGE